MSIAKKLTQVHENTPKVFKAGEDSVWDAIQNYGARATCEFAFIDWGCEYIRPKYEVAPTAGSAQRIFYYCQNLKAIEAKHFDFKNLAVSDTVAASGWYQTFSGCTSLVKIEDIGMNHGYYHNTWRNCSSLETIAKIEFDESTLITDAFKGCASLKNITVVGTIGQSGFDVSAAKSLTTASIESIFRALSDTSTDKWVKFSKEAIEAAFGSVTSDLWLGYVDRKPNWTFVYE